MFKWIDQKLRNPQRIQQKSGHITAVENAKSALEKRFADAVPFNSDKPIHKSIYIASYKSAERSYSVKVVCGFCQGCNPENPKLLATNHVARLFGRCGYLIIQC